MKKLLIPALILCLNLTAGAQQKQEHRQDKKNGACHDKGHKGGKQKMMASLNFTPEQREQLKALKQESAKKMKALNQDQSKTLKEVNDQRSAIRREMRQKREAILTKEQKDKIASMKADRQQKQNERYAKKMEQLKVKAGLSDDQLKKMNALRDKTRTDIEKIKNNDKLNDQEKRTQIKTLVENAKKDRFNLMSKDQLIAILSAKKGKRTEDKSADK